MKKILLFLSLSLISLLSTAQLPTSLRDGTLVCYYQMDTIVGGYSPDSSTFSKNLTITSSGVISTIGKFNKCLKFSSSTVNSVFSDSIDINTSMTLSMWVKKTNTTLPSNNIPFFKFDSIEIGCCKYYYTNNKLGKYSI